MSFFLIGAVLAAAGGFTATPLDDGSRIVLSSTRPATENKDVRCRWTLYKDALPAASGAWYVQGLGAGSPMTNAAPEILGQLWDRGGDFALRVRFVTGEDDPDKEKLLAVSQIDYPRKKVRPLSAFVGKPAVLATTPGTYEFTLPSVRIRFDRATGLLSGYATGWWSSTEWFRRPMTFDFGEDAPRIRLETFTPPAETNGVWSFRTVSWWKDSAKNFEIRVATDWQVRGDGRVVSSSAIRAFGLPRTLPRVGWAFVLAPPDPLVQYYGRDPAADSSDRRYEGLTGLYSSTAAGCGRHDAARAVSFDAGSDHLAFSTLGDDFSLEVGTTPSKATFCGLVADREAPTDRDWRLDVLVSPEKTLQALALPPPVN